MCAIYCTHDFSKESPLLLESRGTDYPLVYFIALAPGWLNHFQLLCFQLCHVSG